MEIIKQINMLIPDYVNNIASILTIILFLLSVFVAFKNNLLGFILKRKQRKKYRAIVTELTKDLEQFWEKEEPNIGKFNKILKQFKKLNLYISDIKFKQSPSDYRSFLYDFMTMDVEDSNIFKTKKFLIDRHIATLLSKLKEYEKYIC